MKSFWNTRTIEFWGVQIWENKIDSYDVFGSAWVLLMWMESDLKTCLNLLVCTVYYYGYTKP